MRGQNYIRFITDKVIYKLLAVQQGDKLEYITDNGIGA